MSYDKERFVRLYKEALDRAATRGRVPGEHTFPTGRCHYRLNGREVTRDRARSWFELNRGRITGAKWNRRTRVFGSTLSREAGGGLIVVWYTR